MHWSTWPPAPLRLVRGVQALAQIARPPLAPRKINLWATIRTAHQGWSKAAEEPGTLRTAKLEEHFTRVKGLFEAGRCPRGPEARGPRGPPKHPHARHRHSQHRVYCLAASTTEGAAVLAAAANFSTLARSIPSSHHCCCCCCYLLAS